MMLELARKYAVPAILVLCLVLVSVHLIERGAYETSGVFTWDTPVYMAVATGIANGLLPYSDLFEIKPPGIFITGLIGNLLGNQLRFLNFAQLAAMIGTLTFFWLVALLWFRQRLRRDVNAFALLALVCLLAALIVLYMMERSGEVQIESFGAAFAVAYAFFVFRFRDRQPGFSDGRFWLLAGLLLCSVGYKEPFALVNFAVVLVLVRDLRSIIRLFVAPLSVALLFGTLVLLAAGILDDYLSYLGYMTSSWTTRSGSVMSRAMDVSRLLGDLAQFARGLDYAVVVLFGVWSWRSIFGNRRFAVRGVFLWDILVRLGRPFLVVVLATIAVSLGGEYYNHHFAFAVPVYAALLVALLDFFSSSRAGAGAQAVFAALSILAVVGVLTLPNLNLPARKAALKQQRIVARAEARYIDAVLDRTGLERWLFLGSNGPEAYGFTRHSPLGPVFNQFNFPGEMARIQGQVVRTNVALARLVVFGSWRVDPATKKHVEKVLAEEFTLEPWTAVQDIKRTNPKYKIYFRKPPGAAGLTNP